QLLRQLAEQLVVALAFRQLEQLLQVPQRVIARAPLLERALGALQVRHGLLRLLGPVPEAGLGHALLELAHLPRARLDVKDTSAPRRGSGGPGRAASSDRRWSAWCSSRVP